MPAQQEIQVQMVMPALELIQGQQGALEMPEQQEILEQMVMLALELIQEQQEIQAVPELLVMLGLAQQTEIRDQVETQATFQRLVP
jgi:hypothetical protein